MARVAKSSRHAMFRTMTRSRAGAPERWLDDFTEWWLGHQPVSATYAGDHRRDHRLPNATSGGSQQEAVGAAALLRTPSDGTGFEALDLRLARGALRIRRWEIESGHATANPATYTGEAAFGAMAHLLRPARPMEERLDALLGRLDAMPAYLAAAADRLAGAPVGWIARARRECDGLLAFLDDGLSTLSESGDGHEPAPSRMTSTHARELAALAGAAERASAAVRRYREGLDGVPVDEGRALAGEEAFVLHLTEAHAVAEPPAEIARYARDELDRVEAASRASARAFGEEAPAAVLERLADHHPSIEGYLSRYTEIWEEMRVLAEEAELVTWPEAPIRYVPRPRWSRAAAPHLYFLFYRSPPAFERPAVHDYLVTPIERSIPPLERDALLRSHNDYVIKTNHVVHHGGIGHHVQNHHAFRSPSRIGRVAAVDGASRIAMLCGGTMAEGWACYATDLMAEVGALTDLERFAHDHSRIRMCARAVVDCELHTGRMSADEAIDFYRRRAGMSEAAARAEVTKNGMFPGGAVMYLVGTDTIHRLRSALSSILGDDFTLRSFHDAFLSYGSIPVRLIAEEMTRRARAGQPLGAHALPWGATR